MPTLQELKDKWFIDENTIFIDWRPPLLAGITFEALGLHFRHAGTALENHTDGNSVTPLFGEGAEYMKNWYEMISDSDVNTVFQTSWTIDNVQTYPDDPSINSNALDVLIDAVDRGASVFQFIDGNRYGVNIKTSANDSLNSGGVASVMEYRFPFWGSNHQKFMVAKTNAGGSALVGSIDITEKRFDTNSHSNDPRTHDFGVLVEGPAVADIEKTFVERWNNPTRIENSPFHAVDPDHPEITQTVGSYATTGSQHSIQVLRTYGIGLFSYSWANNPGEGEFSIWASTLNAIKKAETYIYIEDQTFLTFAWPPCCDQNPNPDAQETDLIYQLGEALKRGVRLGVIVDFSSTLGFGKYQRNYSLNFLSNIAESNGSNFFVAFLVNGTNIADAITVHSKMFLVDDEFALIGSANFDQRSMCHDGELKLGIVDEEGLFVKNLRSTLYEEHSEQNNVDFSEPVAAFDLMKSYVHTDRDTGQTTGRLNAYHFEDLTVPEYHAFMVNNVIWPYAGPENLR